MADHLAVYLQDHLAGARFAIQLLKDLSSQAADPDVARFSAALLVEVEADRATLHDLVERIGGETNTVKETAAWVAQKASRFKLILNEPIGTFEAIEMLSLGVQGKIALWNALRAIRESETRLGGLNLDELASRASKQFAQLEALRLQLAHSVLVSRRE